MSSRNGDDVDEPGRTNNSGAAESAGRESTATDPVATGRPMTSMDLPMSGRTIDIRRTELARAPDAEAPTLPERSDPELMLASEIGEYRVIERIGTGGCSSVYAAESTETGERVALKVLRAGLAGSRRQVMRFVQEAQAVQRIEHPCIVPIYETGYLPDGRPYLVMELVDGESLTQILFQRGRMSPAEVLTILEPVCEALARAHEAGIVHRDIKASNIMVSGGVDGLVVRLLDFGIAKLLTSESGETLKTSMGRVVGTPQSMAPEQILGHPVTGRTDIYALGILLFRMLTGRHPYSSPDAQVVVQMHMTARPPKTSEFAPTSRDIDDIIARAMAKDPAQRYDNPRALIAALRQAMRAESAGGRQIDGQLKAGLAIYVDARMPPTLVHDDATADDLMSRLDTTAYVLREHGFTIVLETSEAVLGVILSSVDASVSEQTAALDDVLKLAAQVRAQLADDGDSQIHYNVCVHRGHAIVRPGNHDHGIISGPITDIGSWAPATTQSGVWTSFSIASAHAAADADADADAADDDQGPEEPAPP